MDFMSRLMTNRSVKANENAHRLRFHNLSRRAFLRRYGIASSAITFSPFLLDRLATFCQAAPNSVRVYKALNGDCFQNTAKVWEMLGGPSRYIGANDIVVIKGNAQWPNQGYTHTGCIKGVIDQILAIPGFSGEILICDDVQNTDAPGELGFDATLANRTHNWPDMNWNDLAQYYQSNQKPVATVQWQNDTVWRPPPLPLPSWSVWNPADGPGWSRYFLNYNGRPTYISYPIFQSPLTPGRMIDMKNGVWENGNYTDRKIKAIFMPTLNNHGDGVEDVAGVTSAIKSFFGATEIYHGDDAVWNSYYHIHSSSFTQGSAFSIGELVGLFINTMYAPVLFITAAMWSGWYSRTGDAAETKTVLACENPVSLDYISCRDVISPYVAWLNPDLNNNTRNQILGCNNQGIGVIDPQQIEVVTYDFNKPTANRVDIERKIRDFKAGQATEQDVKDTVKLYMESE
jgi:hypothetical protein